MKLSLNSAVVALLLFFCSPIWSLTIEDLPSCALDCFTKFLQDKTCSSSNLCQSKLDPACLESYSPCFQAACSAKDTLSTLNITSVLCHEPVRNISYGMRIFVIVATVFASAIISTRVLIKFKGLAGGIGWDDWTIVIAVPFTCIAAGGQYAAAYYGLGRDAWKVPFPAITGAYRSFYVSTIGYKLGNAASRISILCFYLRIFGTTRFRYVVWVCILLNVSTGVAFAMVDALHCWPVSFFWNGWDGEHVGSCWDFASISWAHSIINIILDIITLGIAVWMVKKLKMELRKKFSIIGMFVLGSAITIVSFLRLQALPRLKDKHNETWNYAPIAYWSAIEMLAGLVCACLPALKAVGALFGRQRKVGYSYGDNTRGSTTGTRSARQVTRGKTPDPTLTFSENEDFGHSLRGQDSNSVTELVDIKKPDV